MSGADIASEVEAGLSEALANLGPPSDAVIVRRGPQTGESHNPVPGQLQGYPCIALQTKFSQSDLANTVIAQCDKKILVGAETLAIRPTTAMRFQQGDISYAIEVVEALEPAGTPLLWKLYLKGSQPAQSFVPGAPVLDDELIEDLPVLPEE